MIKKLFEIVRTSKTKCLKISDSFLSLADELQLSGLIGQNFEEILVKTEFFLYGVNCRFYSAEPISRFSEKIEIEMLLKKTLSLVER